MEQTEKTEARCSISQAEDTEGTSRGAELSDFYGVFCSATIRELQDAIIAATDTEERAFYRKLLNLKLQTEQEKIVGERLV